MTATGIGIVWFRRDLRLGDHPALAAALDTHERIVPLFVRDPALIAPAGAPRLAFLHGCLEELDRSLGGRLVVRSGPPADVVPRLAAETGATAVWYTGDFGPYGAVRDAGVATVLARSGVTFESRSSTFAVTPGELRSGSGGPYRVFTPFYRAWLARGWDPPLGRPELGRRLAAGIGGEDLGEPPPVDARLPDPGEGAAARRLDLFLRAGAQHYAEDRNRPDGAGTSRLSPYLHFGCIHPRQILDRLDPGDPGSRSFERQLCWRDFYADVLHHRPDSARSAYQRQWRSFATDTGPLAERRFAAWAEGRTGYPIVDAGMRQLQGEAWMHNRVRLITASFLVKDLHLDWRLGARWFMRHLVDGDLASNQHGWQWVAGTGTDAAPYHRVFNPIMQARRFDPSGDYVRRWVPELAGLGGGDVHEPWRGKGSLFNARSGYPAPVVDHAAERRETLARYDSFRRGPQAAGKRAASATWSTSSDESH